MTKPQVVIMALVVALMSTGTSVPAQGEAADKITAPAAQAAPVKAAAAADASKDKAAAAEAAKAQEMTYEKMTKADIVTRIKNALTNKDEIIQTIQGLAKEQDASGNVAYKYNGVKLDDVDKETLWKILGRAQNEATRINMDRLNRQLAQIKQIEAANRAAQQSRQIRSYNPPRTTPQTPNIPRTPSTRQRY